jgi:hypothetical protein
MSKLRTLVVNPGVIALLPVNPRYAYRVLLRVLHRLLFSIAADDIILAAVVVLN